MVQKGRIVFWCQFSVGLTPYLGIGEVKVYPMVLWNFVLGWDNCNSALLLVTTMTFRPSEDVTSGAAFYYCDLNWRVLLLSHFACSLCSCCALEIGGQYLWFINGLSHQSFVGSDEAS